MKPSESIKTYIKKEEGLSLGEYDDRGVGSVGYGIRGTGKKTVTPAEAEADFINRLNIAEKELTANVTRPNMTQSQWDALYDKHYNMGLTKMKDQGFLNIINNGTDEEIVASLAKANKSTHSKTGESIVIDALTKRASDRSAMWNGTYGEAQELDMSSMDEDQELDFSAIDEEVQPELDFSVLDEVEPKRDLEKDLTISLNSFSPGQDEIAKNAQKLSKEFNRPQDEMEAELVDSTYDDVRVKLKTPDIIAGSPKVAEFAASSSDKAVLLKKTKDYLPKIESSAKMLNKDQRSMVEKVVGTNIAVISKAYTQLAMVTGAQSVEQGIAGLRRLDKDQATNVINTPEMQELSRVMENMTPVIVKAVTETTKAWDSSKSSVDNILPTLAAIADNTPEFAEAAWELISTVVSNPGTSAALIAQTQLPMVAGATAGIVATPATGVVTAGTLSGLMAFNEYMERQLEPFKNPNTGEVNYELAYSDPKRLSQWRQEAAIYSGVMAGADALFQMSGGFFTKHIASKGAVSKVAKVGAAEAATGFVTEGGSQFLALQATDVYGDRVTTEDTAKNLAEGFTEGIIGMFAGAGVTAMHTGADLVKQGTLKTVDKIKSSKKANEDAVNISELRTKVQEDEAYHSNPQEVDELIDSVVIPEMPIPQTMNDDLETATPSTMEAMELDANANVVNLSPSEFEKYAEMKGLEPMVALESFSPRTQAEYARNRQSDTSVSVPLSEYLRATEEMPELDGLVRFNGNELNAIEANQQLEEIERNPFVLFDQTAYHGSPHDFDSFDSGKIGSGEGAQAFGYGLYFTEDKDIAEWYRDKLSKRTKGKPRAISALVMSRELELNNKVPLETKLQMAQALANMAEDSGDSSLAEMTPQEILDSQSFDSVIANIISEKFSEWDQLTNIDLDTLAYDEDIIGFPTEVLEEIKAYARTKDANKGQLFEVSINIEKDQMLSWEAPYSEQSGAVKEALLDMWNRSDRYTVETLESMSSGQQIYTYIQDHLDLKDAAETSRVLKDAGVLGVKYKAERGRSDKYNFVVFDDKMAKVQRKFYDSDNETRSELEVIESTDPNDTTSRPVNLQDQFRNQEEREVHSKLRNQLTRATFKDTVDPKALDVIADLQFRHLRARAEFTQTPIGEVANSTKFRKATAAEGVRGAFIPSGIEKNFHTIAFTKHADAKTVIHELSHSWLYEMAEDAAHMAKIPEENLSLAQKEYLKAMEDSASLLGLDNINDLLGLDEAKQRSLQEQFANTAEKYFADGKFENSKLKYLFEQMRKWIAAAIRPIKNLIQTNPSLIMDGRFEFVMDTILGATEAIDDAMYPMFEDPLFTEEQLGKEAFAAYQKLRLDARKEAQAEAYIKAHKKPMREREKQLDAHMNELYQKAVDTVEATTSQRLAKRFQEAWKAKSKDSEENRLSYESVRDVLAKGSDEDADMIKKNVPTYMMTGKKKGGMDIGLLMMTYQIHDPAIMLELLLETGKKDQMIEAEFNKLVKEFEPSLKSDAEIHDIALDAVNNEGRSKLILDEFKILASKNPTALRKLGGFIASAANTSTDILAKIFKESAAATIPNSNAYKFSPTKYFNEMMRSRRRASEYFKAGDMENAIKFKQEESQQFHNYKEAQKLKPLVARSIDRISKLTKDISSLSRAPFYDLEVMKYGVQIVIAAREGNFAALKELNVNDISPISAIGQDGVKAINAAFNNFNNSSNGRLGDNISVASMIALGDLVKTVMHQAREAKTLFREGTNVSLRESGMAFKEEVGEGKSIDTFNTKHAGLVEGYAASTTNVRTVLESLYDSREAYINGQAAPLMEDIAIAEMNRNTDLTKHTNKIVDALRKVAKQDTKLQALFAPILNSRLNPWKTSVDKTSRPIFSKDLNHTFNNISEVLSAMLIFGSESGASKLLQGRGWGTVGMDGKLDKSKFMAFINQAVADGTINADHINFVNTVFDVMAEIYPQIADVMLQVDGVPIGKVEAIEYDTPVGKIKGGYFPVSQAPGFDSNGNPTGVAASTTDFTDLMSADTLGTDAHQLFPMQNLGITKHRDDSKYPVDLNLSKIIPYLGASMNIVHLRKPLKNIGKFFNTPDVKQTLDARRPGFTDTVLNPWFTRVLRQEYTKYSPNPIEGGFRFLRHRLPVVMYFGAITSGVKQIFGLAPVIHTIGVRGPDRISWASTKFLTNPVGVFKGIAKKSKYMEGRRADSQKQFVRSFERLTTNFDWMSDAAKWTSDKSFALIQFGQNIVDTIAWTAAYDHAIGDMTEDRAIAYADNVVKATQSDPSVSEMPAILAGTDMVKFVTAVSSQILAMHNLMRVETMRDQHAAKKAATIASFVVVGLLVTGLMESLLMEAVYPPEDDEEKNPDLAEEEASKRIMARSASNIVDSAIPIVGRLATGMASLMLEGEGGVALSPAFARTGKAAVGSAKAFNSFTKGMELTPYEMSGLMDAFSFISGLPFSKLGDLNKLEYDSLEPWERRKLMLERRNQGKIYEAENR